MIRSTGVSMAIGVNVALFVVAPGLFVALGHPRFYWRPFVPGSRYLEPYPYAVIGSAGDLPLSVVR
jgi:hypothetical protein